MRLLVVWDVAGVLTPVSQWMNQNGHEVRIVMRREQDAYGLTESSGCAIMVGSPKEFYREIIRQIRSFKPDVIHVNRTIRGLLIVRMVTLRTPVIFTYHGSEVRGRDSAHAETRLADKVTVTTQDLQKYGEWLDRPVHEMFHYRGGRVAETALAFYASNYIYDTRTFVEQWCDNRDIELTLCDRTNPERLLYPHVEMPEFYSKFEFFLDFKGHGKEQFALSRSALEAMACGCKVVHDSAPSSVIDPTTIKSAKPEDYLSVYESLERASRRKTIKRTPLIFSGLVRWLLGRIP